MPKPKTEQEMVEELSLNGLLFTKEACDAIRSQARDGYEFVSNAVEVSPGLFYVPMARKTMDALRSIKLYDESPSDVIIRIIGTKKGLN